MTEHTTDLKRNIPRVALLFLVVVIIGIILFYIVLTFLIPPQIALGDCADVEYTGRFNINGTVIESTYTDVENSTGGTAARIFVNPYGNLSIPEGYETYSSIQVRGFQETLIGMNAGETKTVTIPAEDAYGTWNITLAVESGFGPYPIDSILNRTITENRSSFEYLFSDVNLAINSTFDYGETIFFISDILNATITQLNSTDITYKLMPKDNATFLLPLFNWNVTFHVYNESSFTIHSDVHVNHSFSDTEFGEPIHFKIVSVNETDAIMAMNVGAPDISYIDQPITYDIKVLAVHKTS